MLVKSSPDPITGVIGLTAQNSDAVPDPQNVMRPVLGADEIAIAASIASLATAAGSPSASGPVKASGSDTGFVIIGSSPDFKTFGGLWVGVANANRTFANATLLTSGIDQHTATLSAVQTGTQAGFVNLTFNGANANNAFQAEMDTAGVVRIGFFGLGGPLGAKQTITGALSTVADAPAKAVLTSIIAALVAYGLVTNSTT